MIKYYFLITIITTITLFTLSDSQEVCSDYSKPPTIEPLIKEHILNYNDTLTLSCYGKQAVTWRTNYWNKRYNIRYESLTSNKRTPYKAILEVTNINYFEVGYYTCVYSRTKITKDTTLEQVLDLGQASAIYVFVNDPQNSGINLRLHISDVDQTMQPNEPIIIPCRPSSPDISVGISEYKNNEHVDVKDMFVYDNKIGFKAKLDLQVENIKYFRCEFERNKVRYLYDVFPIYKDNIIHIEKGSNISLDCWNWLYQKTNNSLYWKYNSSQSDSITTENITLYTLKYTEDWYDVVTHSIHITNITNNEQGKYICIKETDNVVYNKDQYNIITHDIGEDFYFMNLTSPNINVTATKCSAKKLIKQCLVCNINSYPKPKHITWYDNRGNPILFTHTKADKYTLQTSRNTRSIMCINNVNRRDYGKYKIKVDNDHYTKSLTFTVNFQDKTSVNTEDVEDINIDAIMFEYPSSDPSCGVVLSDHTELIRNGVPTKPGDWPWHVALFKVEYQGSRKFICGGTLVDRYKVVTAAHCVTINNGTILPERIIILAGKPNFDTDDGDPQERSVHSINVHPMFTRKTLKYDIAVMKLAFSIFYNDFIQPICLWDRESIDKTNIYNKFGTVVGWGLTEKDELSSHLLKTRLPVADDAECLKSNPNFYSRFLFDYTFCAGYRNGTSVCNGDSGGGMYFSEKINERRIWFLRGIVSLTISKEGTNKCDPFEYTIFTDAAYFRDFIDQTL